MNAERRGKKIHEPYDPAVPAHDCLPAHKSIYKNTEDTGFRERRTFARFITRRAKFWIVPTTLERTKALIMSSSFLVFCLRHSAAPLGCHRYAYLLCCIPAFFMVKETSRLPELSASEGFDMAAS